MELRGVRFGRLLVIDRAPTGKRIPWRCICDCGNEVVRSQIDLRAGDTTSCGCLKKEMITARNTTHDMCGTTAYSKWLGMWKRIRQADEPKNACYEGVKVCKRWEKFENFYEDMGEPPKGYSLDRISNSKGYSKRNCRWVPLAQQARNKTNNVMYKGMCLSAFARSMGISAKHMFDRINRLGWDIERAVNTPIRSIKRRD